jgi:hypothetical protein
MNDIRTQKAGRPSVINEDIIRKLEACLSCGFSVSFACSYAGISTSTFYEHKALEDEFKYRVHRAEEWATLRARQVILDAIDKGDVSAAKWYLERKSRFEFAPPKDM